MQLTFYKKEKDFWLPETGKLSVYLRADNWNDYSYRTLYEIILFDENGSKHNLGHIKIANFGQTTETRIELPEQFESLDERYFSLGQSPEYYQTIKSLSTPLRTLFLSSINDIVFDEDLRLRTLSEDVMQTSVLRGTTLVTIQGQYKRILNGDALLTPYNFLYKTLQIENEAGYELSFNITPNSNPPTNIHVLIGRNGVGKTHLLNNMVKSFINVESQGNFEHILDDIGRITGESFSRVVSVSYSAFDKFEPYSENLYPNYSYIGLKQLGVETTKGRNELAKEFFDSVNYCFGVGKKNKWINAVKSLESDPLFREINIIQLIDYSLDEQKTINLFKRLSSGHSIVLLTITKLVEKIEEKTLVLLDEPEAHLHPPLQSAFIRALSDLLINRNAVAIIATHSPVIAQEVPKMCVWKLSRFGCEAKAERFESETFGETIGKLTHEVFGLEVNESGFYKLLIDDVNSGKTYEQISQKYNEQLGFEAKLLLRALLNNNSREELF